MAKQEAKHDSTKRAQKIKLQERMAIVPFKDRKQQKALEAVRLFDLGWTNDDIAFVLGYSDGRAVRQLRSEADRYTMDGPDPKGIGQMTPRHKAMIEPWLDWRDHSLNCQECRDDSFEGHDILVDKATEGFVNFFERFNREDQLITDHARAWIWASFRHQRLLLNVPPRHAKSTYLSEWVPIFLVCSDRNVQVLIISQTGDFAKKFCRFIATEMSENGKLIEAFGRFVPTDAKKTWSPSQGELKVEGSEFGDRSIQIRGAQQQVLGMEADWITCDDPDDPDIARSEVQRQRLRDWYDEQVISRGSPGAHVTVIGQRVGLNDMYGWLSEKRAVMALGEPKVYKHIVSPAILDWEAKTTLWPQEWPFDRLIKERYNDNPTKFETMYQQNPVSEGRTIFNPQWINGDASHPGCLDNGRSAGEPMVADADKSLPISRVLSVDPSPTQYSAFIVADVVHNYSEFHASLMHLQTEKIHGREILNHIDQLLAIYAPIDYLIIEDSAVSKWIFQDPWYETVKYKTQVRSHKTNYKNKGDVDWGVQSLAVDFEFGRIRFPWGDAEGRQMSELLLQEMYAYTTEEKVRQDLIMALWFIRFAHRALVPKVRLEGGYRANLRVSPVVQRALKRKDSDLGRTIKEFRHKYGQGTAVGRDQEKRAS